MGGSEVPLCSVQVACCLPGISLGYVSMRAQGKQTDDVLSARTHKTSRYETREIILSTPTGEGKNKSSARHALPECADRGETSTNH